MPRYSMKAVFIRWIEYIQGIGARRGWSFIAHWVALVATVWIPSQLIVVIGRLLMPQRIEVAAFSRPLTAIIGAIILAPLVETYGMRWIFGWLGKFCRSSAAVLGISSVVWGALHLTYDGWGLHAVWAFFVLGLCYLSCARHSVNRAMVVTTMTHSACNALSYALYLATS